MLADLHCHTTFSDGVLSPAELVAAAALCGLGQIAITDHDTVGGCAAALKASREEKNALKVFAGIELSIEAGEDEVHLLGLAIDHEDKVLNDYLAVLREDRLNRTGKIIDLLKKLGYPLDEKDIMLLSPGVEALGRPHMAAALVAKGYFPNQQEVFDKLLYNGGPAYISHLKPSLAEAIKLVHDAGGLAVIAHPHAIKEQQALKEAASLGLDALEVYYPRHTPEQVAHYLDVARQLGLKASGGSDFHGIQGKYPPRLGCYTVSTQILNLW